MKFIEHLARAWRTAKLTYKFDYLAESPDAWTQEDALGTNQFFNSDTGKKLKIHLTNFVVKSAVTAIHEPPDQLQKAAGIALGVKMTVEAMENLLSVIPPTEKAEKSDDKQEEEPPAVIALR